MNRKILSVIFNLLVPGLIIIPGVGIARRVPRRERAGQAASRGRHFEEIVKAGNKK